MMKKINDVSSVALDTTEKGHKLVEEYVKEYRLSATNSKICFLLALEGNYFNAEGGIDTIFENCQDKYLELYNIELSLTRKEFAELITENIIRICMVFWPNLAGLA